MVVAGREMEGKRGGGHPHHSVGLVPLVFIGEAKSSQRRGVREALHDGIHETRVAQVGQSRAHFAHRGPLHAYGAARVQRVRHGDTFRGVSVGGAGAAVCVTVQIPHGVGVAVAASTLEHIHYDHFCQRLLGDERGIRSPVIVCAYIGGGGGGGGGA